MNIFGKTFGLLVCLALLGALGAGGYFALEFVVGLFASLEPQVARVTAIACAVALLASLIVTSGIREAGRKSKAAWIRERKAAAYQFFIDCQRADEPEKLKALDGMLALYGGATVIKAHAALRAFEREKGVQHPDARAQLGKVLLEIRKDLGSDVYGIAAADLQQLVSPVSGSGVTLAPRG